MKKAILSLLIISVTLATGYYLYNQYSQQQPLDLEQAMSKNKQESVCSLSKEGSYIEMIFSGKNFRSKTIENSITVHVINKDNVKYSWTEGEAKGFKVVLPSTNDNKTAENLDSVAANAEYWENEGYNIDCQKENVPDSTFVPPKEIEFTELTLTEQSVETNQQGEIQDDSTIPIKE